MIRLLLVIGCVSYASAAAQAPRRPPRDSAEVFTDRGAAAYRDGNRAAAIQWLGLAAATSRDRRPIDAGMLLAQIGQILHQAGQYDSARRAYRAALTDLAALGLDSLRAYVNLLIGETFHAERRIADSAQAYYRPALSVARRSRNSGIEAQALQDIGVALLETGEPDSAMRFLAAGLKAARHAGDQAVLGTVLNNLARAQQIIGRPDSAVALLTAALRIAVRQGDRAGEAQIVGNIGYAHALAGRHREAMQSYRRTLSTPGAPVTTMALTWTNLGRTFLALGQPDSALAAIREALRVASDSTERWSVGWALDDLGAAYLAVGSLDSAEVYFERARAAHSSAHESARLGLTLSNLARLALKRGDRRLALELFESAAVTRDSVRSRAGGDLDRVSFADQDAALIDDWALAWLAPTGGPTATDLHGALAAVERGRGRGLLDLRGNARQRTAHGFDGSTESALARLVGDGRTVLVLQPTADTLLAFIASPTAPLAVVRTAVNRDSLARLVGDYRQELGVDESSGRGRLRSGSASSRAGRSSGSAGRSLARILVPPGVARAGPDASELVLVVGGYLSLVPFAALPIDDQSTMLGEVAALRILPSLMLAGDSGRGELGGDGRPVIRQAIVIGDPRPHPTIAGQTFDSLPWAAREARAVATRLGTMALTGTSATKKALRAHWSSADVIHLATHGFAFASEAQARSSFIVLSGPTEPSASLTMAEITDDPDLTLTASLVALSACQTAVGSVRLTEGALGIQRALLGRGASAVLASLWSVDDRATALLMQAFYDHWLGDPDRPGKARSLRRAQADLRANPRYRNPVYWAGFQLWGAH